jgi:hypothetical protein
VATQLFETVGVVIARKYLVVFVESQVRHADASPLLQVLQETSQGLQVVEKY